MNQVSDSDVNCIREWLAKEPHLPKDFSDNILRKFIFSCFNSLEQTKKCIDNFCTYRTTLHEVYTDRDPTSDKIQNAYSIINVTSYAAGSDEIVIHQLHDSWEKVDFYAAIMSFTTEADNWLRHHREQLYEGHIIIIDIKEYTLLLLTRVNIFYYQKFIVYLLESMPIRLKQIHLVNCPPFTEYMYNLVKGALPEEIRNMIKFHTTTDGLHDHIDKKYLPKEYGGEAASMHEEHKRWVKEIVAQRDFYLDNNRWKADLSKKIKCAEKDTTMNGTFRTLAID